MQQTIIIYIVSSTPSEVPKGVKLQQTVIFAMVQDLLLEEQVIVKYLLKLLNFPTFQLPKDPKVVSKGSLLESTKVALEIVQKNTKVSVVIKVN